MKKEILLDLLKQRKEQLLSEAQALDEVIRNIHQEVKGDDASRFITHYEQKFYLTGTSGNKYSYPLKYDKDLTWNEKLIYTLHTLKTWTSVSEMVEYLMSIDKKIKPAVALKQLTLMASRLKMDGVLEAEKAGSLSKYRLHKTNDNDTNS